MSVTDLKYGSRGSKDESNFKVLCQVDLNVTDVVHSELSDWRAAIHGVAESRTRLSD